MRALFRNICLCFEIRQSTIYYAGLLGRWDKWIVDQGSDVPSLIFFCTSYRDRPPWLRALKTLYFYFCNFMKKKKWKGFCKEFCKILWRKIILGTSDAWLTSHLSHRPSEPVYYIVDWLFSSDCRNFDLNYFLQNHSWLLH